MIDQPEGEPSHLPVAGATLQPRGWYLAVVFAPPIRLQRSAGLDFARRLAQHINATDVNLGEQAWAFTQPTGDNPNSHLKVTVVSNIVRLEANYPPETQEVFEVRASSVFREFSKQFMPTAMIQTAAMIRGQLKIDGDARQFLANHITRLNPQRIDSFKRPIHGIGLTVFLPALSNKGDEPTDWQLQLTIESLREDPSQLYIEADAQWPRPKQWSDATSRETADHLRIVTDYVESNVMSFLSQQK